MKIIDVLKGLVGVGGKKSKKKSSSSRAKSKSTSPKSKRSGSTSIQKRAGKVSRKTKRTAKNEFRYNNQTKHPNYIFEEQGNRYHSLGITHHETTKDKKGRKHKNMPLKNNPDKGDSNGAYIRYGVITDKKKNYSERTIKRLKFSEDDFALVKSKVRNYKKERKKRQRKKTND